MYYSPVRHSIRPASWSSLVRLACIRHAASVYPEPGSNSSFDFCTLESLLTRFLNNWRCLCSNLSVQFSKISLSSSLSAWVSYLTSSSLATTFLKNFYVSVFIFFLFSLFSFLSFDSPPSCLILFPPLFIALFTWAFSSFQHKKNLHIFTGFDLNLFVFFHLFLFQIQD